MEKLLQPEKINPFIDPLESAKKAGPVSHAKFIVKQTKPDNKCSDKGFDYRYIKQIFRQNTSNQPAKGRRAMSSFVWRIFFHAIFRHLSFLATFCIIYIINAINYIFLELMLPQPADLISRMSTIRSFSLSLMTTLLLLLPHKAAAHQITPSRLAIDQLCSETN